MNKKAKFFAGLSVIGILALVAVIIFIASYVIIPQGYIGVERSFSGAILRALSPGFHLLNPIHRVEKVDNHYLIVNLQEEGGAFRDWLKASLDPTLDECEESQKSLNATLSCSVKGQQTAYIAVTFGYNYAPEKYIDLRRRVAGNVEEILIRPLATDAVKSCASRFSANELVTERDKFEESLKEALITPLKNEGVTVRFVAVKNIFFTSTFERSLSKKALAEQEMKKNALEAIQAAQQARLDEVKAVGESAASSIKEVAASRGDLVKKQASADAEKATLEAKAKASKALSAVVTSELNSYNAVESWEGKLPSEVMLPSEAITSLLGN